MLHSNTILGAPSPLRPQLADPAEPPAGVAAAPLVITASAGTTTVSAEAAAVIALGHAAGTVARSGDARIDGILAGVRWTEARIHYSDQISAAGYGSGYSVDFNDNSISAQFEGFARLSAAQLRTVHAAMNVGVATQPAGGIGFSVEGFTNLVVDYGGAGNASSAIRLANSRDATTAFSYNPSSDPRGGDGFFGTVGRAPVTGNGDYAAILHELGHALGLDHGHTPGGFGALPANWNSLEFSLMTYRGSIGSTGTELHSETWGNPQTFMALDIAALQYLYGADFTTRAGNTVYTWSPTTGQSFVDGVLALSPGGNRILMTVWDGGGIDTYDLSNYSTDLAINLTPGKYSALSPAQLANLDLTSATGLARGSVFNALQYHGDKRSLIEHATAGSGDDKMIGNAIANTLRGAAGDDIIHGGAGRDTLQGQAGSDQLLGGSHADTLIGGTGEDVFDFNLVTDSGGSEIDWIRRGDSAAAFEGRGAPGGDLVDVSSIDANELVDGNQSFGFGTATGVGRLYVREIGNSTLICGNVDNDVRAEFVVLIEDGAVVPSAYTLDDLLL